MAACAWRKTGAGYYRYAEGASRPQVDPVVAEGLAMARSDSGITPRELGAEEIQRRVMLTLVNEAALLLAEGVAERATDVDVVLVNGYGFPRWEGGPVFWAGERGAAALQTDLDELAALSGPGFIRGDVQYLLDTKA